MLPNKTLNVDESYIATFLCPACERTGKLDASEGDGGFVRLEARCECGHAQTVEVDRRRFPRREVDLVGSFRKTSSCERIWSMTIKSISRSGLLFEATEPVIGLEVGEHLLVEFLLHDCNNIQLRREVAVQTLNGLVVGTEFIPANGGSHYERICDAALAYYTLRMN